MRALANSILATLFVLVLLLVLPLIVVFGVPEFVPAVASSGGPGTAAGTLRAEHVGVGQSAGYVPDDLFAGFSDDAAGRGDSFVAADGRSEFDAQRAAETQVEPAGRPRAEVPLDGWEFDERGRARPASDRPNTHSRADLQASTRSGVASSGSYSHGDSVPIGGPQRQSFPFATTRPSEPNPRTAWEDAPDRADTREAAPTSSGSDNPGQQRFRRDRSGEMALDDRSPSRPAASPRFPVATAQASTPADRASLDWNQAVARLRELGIRDYKLTPGSDGNDFHFACIYTPAGGSRVTHRFEAEGAEPLHAIRAVLTQIDDWSSRRR